ncbi:ABC transporter substrate-binding protein [Pelagibacterium luteolum]|uniref:NitT/TauT family transport system substrate-binding protein n=1 Tax=Pelagibacterium luteolum TaxID=440168 RepID=A0A1G7SXK0_9HYPH|nr:ABC transporter substrate-binding protein [Pelagibacterium luteolum]SDG27806.1 NitT/TauT family transport system substrate-binding protein [Pelagibacterium luteolum]
MTKIPVLKIAGLAALFLGTVSPAMAQTTQLNMVLNWKYQGPQGWFFLAEDRGYFAEEGIELLMDQGNGSGAAVPLVANGTYDVGFGDINALVELTATQEGNMPKAVFMLYNQPPFAIAVKSDSDIMSADDLNGRMLGGPASDGALKLFPAFCDLADLDCDSIEVTNMQPNLREQMLMNEQIEGAFGYVNTLRFGAMAMGVNVDEDLRFIRYGDFGMDLYSNAIIVSADLIENQPEVVEGLVRAINRGVKDALADPQAAVEAVADREPLIDFDLELARFNATVEDEMAHPEIAEIGLGAVDMDRLAESIDILVAANELPRTPEAEAIFDPSFLPPIEDRLTSVSID